MKISIHTSLRALCTFGIIFYSAVITAQVANDDCATAIDITGDITGEFFCFDGTKKRSLSDPQYSTPCAVPSFGTVWYKFKAIGLPETEYPGLWII